MYNYLVLYRKNNGEIIYRARRTRPDYKIGELTSMGWKVLDIKLFHKGRALSNSEYNEILERRTNIYAMTHFLNRVDMINLLKYILLGVAILYFITKLH